jgi:hypothetical protein
MDEMENWEAIMSLCRGRGDRVVGRVLWGGSAMFGVVYVIFGKRSTRELMRASEILKHC